MESDVLFCEMMNDVRGFGDGEEAEYGAVTEKAEIAVVGYDVDGGIPRGLGGGGGAWTDVVDCRDVDTAEADAGASLKH